MKRFATLLLVNLTTLLVFAQFALADAANDHGEGWFGETSDLDITIAGFILIAGFPLLVWILSIAYNRLEDRRLRRMAAAKARTARADLRGGW